MSEIADSREIIAEIIPARERFTATWVMETLFNSLSDRFLRRIRASAAANQPFAQDAIDLVENLKLFATGVETASFTFTTSNRHAIEAGGDQSVVPLISKLTAKLAWDRTQTQSATVQLRKPGPNDWADYCAIIVDTLWRAKLVEEVIVLADDVDILENYRDAQHSGKCERSVLAEALARFHKTPCVDVLITSRSWYAQSQKEFQVLIDLSKTVHDLSDDDLMAIHDQRLRHYHPDLPAFLNRDALATVAHAVQGIPGAFLHHLNSAFGEYKEETEWGERDYPWFMTQMRAIFERLERQFPEQAEIIRTAAQNGVRQVSANPKAGFHNL